VWGAGPERWAEDKDTGRVTAAGWSRLVGVIAPASAEGTWGICDRFADSTRLYQGARRSSLRETVDALHALMIGREPDLTIIVDMDPEEGLARAKGRRGAEERFEDFGAGWQRQMRAGFLALAEEFPDRCHVVDGRGSEDRVADRIRAVVRAALDVTTRA